MRATQDGVGRPRALRVSRDATVVSQAGPCDYELLMLSCSSEFRSTRLKDNGTWVEIECVMALDMGPMAKKHRHGPPETQDIM